jgi:hypothetical protein
MSARPDVIVLGGGGSNQGPNRFDRHQHDALAKRGTQETVALVKPHGGLVDGVGDHAPGSGDLRNSEAPSQGVG